MQILRIASFCFSALTLTAASNVYVQHNLVSDVAGVADHRDEKLVNAWGLDRSATGPWWVNANGKGLSLVYDGNGNGFPAAKPLIVTIPAPGGGASTPTGIIFNGSQDFQIAPGKPALFIFATEDGTISGWNPMVDATNAVIEFDSKGGAVYKGLATGMVNGENVLYLANFRSGLVEVLDKAFTPIQLSMGAFRDPEIPTGYGPFNVQNVAGKIAVAFAKQDDTLTDEVAGEGLGYVDLFTPAGVLLRRFHHGKWMNAPWAVTLAPADFGKLSNKFLVGNFGSGQIAAFSESGEFQGLMRGPKGQAVTIDGLWGLGFGNGANAGPTNVLFFAAGPDDEKHGLFGTLTAMHDGDADDDQDRADGDKHHKDNDDKGDDD